MMSIGDGIGFVGWAFAIAIIVRGWPRIIIGNNNVIKEDESC
jgi:hypothetical protein